MKPFRSHASVCLHVFAAAASLLLVSLSLFSQGSTGRILGSVTDQSGGVVAGATVTVLDVQRGVSRTLTTDDAGQYVAINLLPGTYTVRAEAKGFKRVDHSNLLLEVGKDLRVDLTLQPGAQNQTITVTEEAPMVETTNSTLGGDLSNTSINELPLNGRNYQNLLALRPGMMIYPGGGGWTMSTNGSRPEENEFIIDGLTNDNPFQGLTIINGPGVAGDAATLMPIDAIQELNIQENPTAEYGGKPGAVVNVGIKAGTNNVHGTAYAFGRSDAFDARNYFNPPPAPAKPVSLQQFGATVGGPIKKDKLFFFMGYEGERYTVGNSFQALVPEALPQTTPDAANSLPDAIAGINAYNAAHPSAQVPLSQLSLKLTGCTVTPTIQCTGGLFPTNNGTSKSFPQGFPSSFRSDNGVLKIDYDINNQNTLSGSFFRSNGLITAEDVVYLQPQWLSVQDNVPTVAGANWTWTPNSKWANSARFGFIRMQRQTQQADANLPASTYGIYTGVTTVGSLPNILVGGFNNLGGSPAWPIRFGPDTVYQFVDSVSYLHGNHTIRFGADFRRDLADPASLGAAKGFIKFLGGAAFSGSTSLEDLIAGVPTNATLETGTPQRHLRQWVFAGFVQDDWRVKPRLTLNLGLRYDYTTPLADANNLEGGFDPNSPTGMVQVGKQISSLYNGDHTDFGPRIGFAWDVTGKATTVLRAGYSLIFDSLLPMQALTQVGGNSQNGVTGGVINVPTAATIVVNGVSTPGTGTISLGNVTIPGSVLAPNWQNNSPTVPIFPSANMTVCGDGSNGTSPCNLGVMDHNWRDPRVHYWTLGVQHQFSTDLALDVSYVGSHTSKLGGIRDINQGIPNAADAGAANVGVITGQPFAAQFPFLGFIDLLSNIYSSNYNGLQVSLQKRTSHGISFNASYTYSHSLDNDSYNIGQYLPQDSTNPGLEYASSDFDLTHRFTLSLTYEVPGKKSPGELLQGWEINSIVTLQTGQPWYANDLVNNISGTSELADRWDFVGDHNDFKSGNSSVPYCTGTFEAPAAVTCTQVTPTGTVNLSNSINTAAATACFNGANGISAATEASLDSFGCYFQGHSVLFAPALGTFGTEQRNMFRDSGLRDWDLSVYKNWKFQERLTAQFRAEFFNVLNHPNFANPYGASNGYGIGTFADPSTGELGCGCATPDQAAGNPVLGTGGNRAIQLGLKLIF